MDTAAVKKTLLANQHVTKLYSIVCGSLLKEQTCVKVFTNEPNQKIVCLTIHRWNQHVMPDKYHLITVPEHIKSCLDEGGFIIQSGERSTTDGFAYKVRIKRGRKLPYLDLEPVSPRHSSRSMEMGIHDWFERVLGDYLRPIRRCQRIKEQLMMNRWHPDHVLRLLEAGIDVEDM